MKTSPSVISGIEERLRKIQDNPGYFTERAMVIEEGLRHEADLHSFWLEHPELRSKLLVLNGVLTEGELKKIARKGVAQIKSAWEYLTSKPLRESRVGMLGYLTPEVIEEVGKRVDPIKNHTGFRRGYVSSPFPEYTPKSPDLVPVYIKAMCNEIRTKEANHEHVVELAAEAHLRIAGLQPFTDGNKRTARLVERRILEGNGLPTSFIPFGERDVYLDLVTRALEGLNKRDIYAQTPFYDYIGGKVATALDTIIDDLKID